MAAASSAPSRPSTLPRRHSPSQVTVIAATRNRPQLCVYSSSTVATPSVTRWRRRSAVNARTNAAAAISDSSATSVYMRASWA
jgi:hypothetical protein